MAQIVGTVTGSTMAELRAERDAARDADLVELRLDGVADADVAGALQGRSKPVIVTCRPQWEGGRFEGSEEERLKLLSRAAELGAEFIDLEWRANWRSVKAPLSTVVLSHHDFSGLPADLDDRVRAMRSEGVGTIKVAVAAHRLSDCVTLRDITRGDDSKIVIAMGAAGQLTRVWPAGFGSRWTYGGSIAPGQTSVRDLIEIYRVRERSASSALYGLTGAPLCHSLSPAIHNAAFSERGEDAVYVPLETEDADELLRVTEAFSVRGVSVTAPLKRALFDRSSVSDTVSAELGAINTLRRGDSGWESRNFDVIGFLSPLDRRSMTLRRKNAVVLGAGGAARAVVWALKAHGARVAVCARRLEQAAELARAMSVQTASWPPVPGWDLLINTTPVGTWPHVENSPVDRSALSKAAGRTVYDLVYNPTETLLMRWAREAGADVIGGMEMLIAQARAQQNWWHEAENATDDV